MTVISGTSRSRLTASIWPRPVMAGPSKLGKSRPEKKRHPNSWERGAGAGGREKVSRRTFRVNNTHLYLTESPRLVAAKLILAHVAAGEGEDAVLLTADFNASPSVPSRRLFIEAGLSDSAERASRRRANQPFSCMGRACGASTASWWTRNGATTITSSRPLNQTTRSPPTTSPSWRTSRCESKAIP
jgi:endonuclease/exonuclease/phosphatase family metal-dependent hydrolase